MSREPLTPEQMQARMEIAERDLCHATMLLDAAFNAATGQPTSDFEESFPLVRQVLDTRSELADLQRAYETLKQERTAAEVQASQEWARAEHAEQINREMAQALAAATAKIAALEQDLATFWQK